MLILSSIQSWNIHYLLFQFDSQQSKIVLYNFISMQPTLAFTHNCIPKYSKHAHAHIHIKVLCEHSTLYIQNLTEVLIKSQSAYNRYGGDDCKLYIHLNEFLGNFRAVFHISCSSSSSFFLLFHSFCFI